MRRPARLALDPSDVLFAADYFVHDPALDGVYDPRLVTLTADGTLVLERRDVDAIMGATATDLDGAGLDRAWSAIAGAGVFTDGLANSRVSPARPLPPRPTSSASMTARDHRS